jgi:hypothetical protein
MLRVTVPTPYAKLQALQARCWIRYTNKCPFNLPVTPRAGA